jgi:hypothetical protein
MTWGFLWLMLALKIPIGGMLYIVWWAVHQVDEPETAAPGPGEGGSKRPRHPRGPLPRTPRRGAHNTPAHGSPPRVRSVVARARNQPPV